MILFLTRSEKDCVVVVMSKNVRFVAIPDESDAAVVHWFSVVHEDNQWNQKLEKALCGTPFQGSEQFKPGPFIGRKEGSTKDELHKAIADSQRTQCDSCLKALATM